MKTLEEKLIAIGERAHRIGQGLPVPKRFIASTEEGQIVVVENPEWKKMYD